MGKLLSVVETAAYLGKTSKMMSEGERASIVDMIAATPQIGVLIRGTGGPRGLPYRLEANVAEVA